MSRIYAIADLHGRFDLLQDALHAIEMHEPGTVVFLGDYIDRGPNSRQIIERLIAGPTKPGWTWVCLKGNHEDMMVQTLRTPLDPNWWIGNGGGATLASYGHPFRGEYQPEMVPNAHVDWIAALPLMHVDQHRVFVHAGVDSTRALDKQDEQELLWKRVGDRDEGGHGDRFVVHGHTPIVDGPKRWAGRIDLDTLAWKTGRLVVGVFDDEVAGGPVDLIEVRRPQR